MAEILSQQEIDSLLSALSTGEINADEMKEEKQDKKVKVYDFKRPNKFNKEQLRALNIIHENFARMLTTYFSAKLRTLVKIEVFSVEQMSYYEFISSIPNPSIIAITDLYPLEGSGILEINPNINFSVIDRLLGGQGEFNDKIRSLTEIESTLIQKVINDILRILKESWENLVELEPQLENIETNAQFVQLIAPNETVALITLKGEIGKTEGMINFCVPHILLEPVISKLSTRYWFSDTKKEISELDSENLKKLMKKSKVPVKVEIGKVNITVKELIDIQLGDVIKLDKKANDALDVYVEDELKFHGMPGLFRKNIALEITDIVKEGED